MLRDVAHELRTPLTALRGYIDALSDGVLQLDADAVRTLHAELARVERLVDDLATVSRAEERRLDLHLRAMAPRSWWMPPWRLPGRRTPGPGCACGPT